jgi:PAS domain S-box-containing protein
LKEFGLFSDLVQLFDLIPGVQFWMKDAEGRFTACNRAFAGHFGLSGFAEMAGRTDFDVSPLPLAREYVADDRMVMTTGKALKEKLELVREKDGSLHWYATTKVPLRDARGAVIGTAGFTRHAQGVDEGRKSGKGLEKATTLIHNAYGNDLTITGLAATAGMSVDTFERQFRATFRETPLKYLNRIRMRAACGLLIHTELPVGDIARQCGFSDQSYFAKRFFAHLRIRPLEYRKKYSKRDAGSRPTQ